MTPWNETALREEVEYFHWLLFRSAAPPAVADRYVQLHNVCFPDGGDPAERRTVDTIVQHRLDAEGIECAFRLRGRRHLLTRKLHALLYLVEVRRDYYPLFFNDEPQPVIGKLRLLGAVLTGVRKAAAGEILIRRRRLA